MRRIHILGRKNHGKTTLVVELIEQLTAQGHRVAAIKHTHHAHQLDVPGKDSYRFGQAGAAAVGILSREQNALFWPTTKSNSPTAGESPDNDDNYESFTPFLGACDLVLVEGDTQCAGIKIEVWRKEIGSAPMALSDKKIVAVVTDDPIEVPCPVWPRASVEEIAQRVLELAPPE